MRQENGGFCFLAPLGAKAGVGALERKGNAAVTKYLPNLKRFMSNHLKTNKTGWEEKAQSFPS